MAINFSDGYIKTYLDYIDKKAISFFEDKKSIGVNNLINLKDEENNYLSYLKYAYIYIGALYHNVIYSAHYKALANAELPIDDVKLFQYDWISGSETEQKLYSGKRSGGYYIYKNCIYPCYFFFDDIVEDLPHIYFEKIYCISPHFRILIERERREGDPTDSTSPDYIKYQQFEKSTDATKELFEKNQSSSQDHTIKIKVTNLKNINESFENDINFNNNTLQANSINIGFNISTEANNGSNNIEITESDLESLSILINKILYVWNAGSYRGGVYNVNSMDGQTKYTTPGAFPCFSYLKNEKDEHNDEIVINPEIIITISNFIDTNGYLENVKLLQASYEQLIHTFKGINSAEDFFDYFEDNYDTYEPPQDVDSNMGVADIYDLWLEGKNKDGGATKLAILIENLKTMLEQYRFNTTFVKMVNNKTIPIEWDWDNLSFVETLDFALSENKQALKNLFFITTLYQFYSQICSSDELLSDETIKCGIASGSGENSLLTEKEYEEKLCRSTLTKLYNDSTPVDGTKKNIQFLFIDRQEGFGNSGIKTLKTEYADATTSYNGIDPYFNGNFKNSMCRETEGNMSHCCAVNVGGTIRFYYDFYYKTRFHDKPIEGSTVEPYAPKTKKTPHLHAVSTSATCPYAILDDTVGSRNNDAFLVMREKDSAQLDPSNFCIVFIHGSHGGGLRLEKVQDEDTMTDLEYRYRNAMYGPDPLCCLPNPFYKDPQNFHFYTNFESNYDTILGNDFYEKLINYCGDTGVSISVYANGKNPDQDIPEDIDTDQRTKLQTYITQQTNYLKSLNNMYVKLSENDGAMCPKVKEFMEQKMPNIIINNKRYFLPVTVGTTYEQVSITVITAQGDLAERIYVKKYLDDGKTNEVPSGNSGTQGSYPIGKWVVVYDQVTEDGKNIDSLREGYIFDKEQPTPENVGLQLLEVFKSGAYHQGGDDRVLNGTNDIAYPEDDDYAALYQKYAEWGWGTLNEVFGNSRDYSQQST